MIWGKDNDSFRDNIYQYHRSRQHAMDERLLLLPIFSDSFFWNFFGEHYHGRVVPGIQFGFREIVLLTGSGRTGTGISKYQNILDNMRVPLPPSGDGIIRKCTIYNKTQGFKFLRR